MSDKVKHPYDLSRDELVQYALVMDELLEARDRVLAAIPECSIHGSQCVPHAVEWVKKSIILRAGVDNLQATARTARAVLDEVDEQVPHAVEWTKGSLVATLEKISSTPPSAKKGLSDDTQI